MKVLMLIIGVTLGMNTWAQSSLNSQITSNTDASKSMFSKQIVVEEMDGKIQQAKIYEKGKLIEEGVLKNGSREGVWKFYTPDGKISVEASFSQGVKNGVWLVYDQGEVQYVLHYQNGTRVEASNLADAK